MAFFLGAHAPAATADRTFVPVATGTVSHRHLRAIILLGLAALLVASLVAMKRGTEVGAVVVRPGFGDSMIPTSCDGDTIVAWSGRFDIVRGGLYLIRHSGTLLFKQFAGTNGNNLVFVSVNRQHEDNHFEVPRAAVEAKAFAILPTHHLWEGDGKTEEGARNQPKITPAKRSSYFTQKVNGDAELRRQLWWMKETNVVGDNAKSIPSRIVVMSPSNTTMVLMSDRKVGKNATDETTAFVSHDTATAVAIDIVGLKGSIAFKPLSYISTCSVWVAEMDGAEVETKTIGDFRVAQIPTGAKKFTLTCKFTPSPAGTPGAVDRCGIDEVVHLTR